MRGGVQPELMQAVQLCIANAGYAAAVREALSRSGPWHMESVDRPDLTQRSVIVLDEAAFQRLPLPLLHPGRIVLITRPDTQMLAHAWDAGIVSVVPDVDPLNTVLLAIMAAALRVPKPHSSCSSSAISPSLPSENASIPPQAHPISTKRSKTQ